MTAVPDADSRALAPDERERLARLARRSHDIVAGLQQPGGAYPAAPSFSAYQGYAWLRDGGFTADGMSRYGAESSADAFHDWAARTLAERRGQVDRLVGEARAGNPPPNQRMLPTRFTFDGQDGSDPWWDFQTDGYGTWLWSVVTHADRHDSDLDRWRAGIEVAVDYLLEFWDRPCFDWWEEHDEHRHTSTLAAVRGGLVAVARAGLADPGRNERIEETDRAVCDLVATDGVSDGHLTKWLGGTTVDASLLSCLVPFHLVDPDDERAAATLDAVRRDLDDGGGVHRFRADVFYGGGRWPLLSALLGWNLASRGDIDAALSHLRWVAGTAGPEGELPEQVSDRLLHPDTHAEWVDRWGTVATPLLWSHGMYLVLADALGLADGPVSP